LNNHIATFATKTIFICYCNMLLMRYLKKITLLCTFTAVSAAASAQTGSWNIVNLKAGLTEKWSLFAEAQIRSLGFYNNFHYYEYKAGASYSLGKNFTLSAGMGNFDTYAAGGNFKTPMQNDEFRTWLQLTMSQYQGRLKFEHRYRAEQRFTLSGYRNRFRYRLNTVLPLNNKKLQPKTFYLTAANELFFTNRAPYFERNRMFLGGGYEYSSGFAIQAGFLNQFDYRINDETGRNFFQISLLFELERKKNDKEKVPGSMN
jgi:hypothetical protein